MCDFETTVYEGQHDTSVWAAACCELYTENVSIFHSIEQQFAYWKNLKSNVMCWYHNLKFDGEFIIWHLLNKMKFSQALEGEGDSRKFLEEKHMKANTFKYSISSKGMWYCIIIKLGRYFIEIRDSLKLMPFSLKSIGQAFKTKHQKLEMEYTGFRFPGCEIKPEEREYIGNDVLVGKEGLEFMFSEGHDKLTIGSCCLAEFKELFKKSRFVMDYDEAFPDIYEMPIDEKQYGQSTMGDYVLKSYKGAFCHLVKGKERRLFKNGRTYDVNSLYPYVMHSDSGNRYPIGIPHFWKGDYIHEQAKYPDRYYFIRVRTRFYLKPGKLPYIQIKGNGFYKPTAHLETSDIWSKKHNCYCDSYIDRDGIKRPATVELTLTMTDYEIIKQQYDLVDFEILDGCWFYTEIGLFDDYIDKYKQIKMTSTGARRTQAKLFSNNLYGKMAAGKDSSFKVAYLKEDGSLGYEIVIEKDKDPGYIPCGSAITSYARAYTFKVAQANYHGPEQAGFIYADTDSVHLDLPEDEIVGIREHEHEYGFWKCEATWAEGVFVRQKTYIEHVFEEDRRECEPYYNIKCAGMPERCKQLFIESLRGSEPLKRTAKNYKFLYDMKGNYIKREITDFDLGLKVPGKLFPRHIKGGILLVEDYYTMR